MGNGYESSSGEEDGDATWRAAIASAAGATTAFLSSSSINPKSSDDDDDDDDDDDENEQCKPKKHQFKHYQVKVTILHSFLLALRHDRYGWC